jgi:energy-converting hydrogenase Eha subunit F
VRFASNRAGRAIQFAFVAVAVACITLAAGSAHAQPPNTPPGVDHYLVYKVLNPPQYPVPVILSDQFLQHVTSQVLTLEFFMTPVNKNHEGIIDDITHYTWWLTSAQPFGATALVSNQFRPDQALNVFDPHFLLNPALKGITQPPSGPIPPKNHYRVYDANGLPIEVPVSLQDQFYQYQAMVHFPRFLAPPVEKIFQGVVFPIFDPVAHLVIYDISMLPPVAPPPPPVFAKDEFGIWHLELGQPIFLCVPSYKTGVVGTQGTTWGKLKALYR